MDAACAGLSGGAGTAASLQAHLAARIAAAGPISVACYMAAALLHPRWGYYATRDPLGARGDFITAPEVSQVFGELVGLWCVDFWQRLGAPDPFVLAELGPGRGTMMRDALRAARLVPAFTRAARLHLVERSAVLREVQASALQDAAPHFHDDAATLPPGPLILVANEFLDALPIRQYERVGRRWHERRIACDATGALGFVRDPAPTGEIVGDAPEGSMRETRPAALAQAQALGMRLARDGGAALFIDYGHAGDGCGDTLQAVCRHRRHDVLDAPGTADLTAHVDFAAFAAAATAAGARAWGPVTQGRFLGALGIAARTEALVLKATPGQAALLRSGTRRLVDPAAMGQLFKVVALTHPAAPAPAGFAPEDQA
jgi:NADH dehydrogenase [ubiquinone] 1 alpha subcomplex assembly factor 7